MLLVCFYICTLYWITIVVMLLNFMQNTWTTDYWKAVKVLNCQPLLFILISFITFLINFKFSRMTSLISFFQNYIYLIIVIFFNTVCFPLLQLFICIIVFCLLTYVFFAVLIFQRGLLLQILIHFLLPC